MSEAEWLEWAVPRYAQFIEANPNSSPCVSRFNDTGHYELGNLEIISVEENRRRQKAPLLARPDGTKLCARCREVMTVAAFGKSRRRPDGLNHYCRDCTRATRLKNTAP